METDLRESIKDWIDDRKNPYIASVIAVWIVFNRVIVFGIFNFESSLTVQQRITWIAKQFDKFDLWYIPGFYTVAILSFMLGFVVMIGMNLINTYGEVAYSKITNYTIDILQRFQQDKWKSIKVFEALGEKTKEFENEANKLREDLDSMNKLRQTDGKKILEFAKEIEILKESNKNILTRVDKKFSTDLSLVFKGDMVNEYNFYHENAKEFPHQEPFKMDGNKYITTVNNKHVFDIDNVKINLEEKQVIFRKVRVEDSSTAWNFLIIWPDGSLRGFEDDKGNRVKYYNSQSS